MGTEDKLPRSYCYMYGVPGGDFDMAVDPGERKYISRSATTVRTLFFENPRWPLTIFFSSGRRQAMKHRLIAAFLAAFSILLGGCATTIKSEVTAFHDWPQDLSGKTYVFERTTEQNNSLEYRNYENLVRAELNRLGFVETSPAQTPALKVMMGYGVTVRDVQQVYPVVVDSYSPFMNPYWYGPAWRGYYSPFYDPFWYGPPVVEQRVSNYQVYTRQLRIVMARASDNKRVYEVSVISEGSSPSMASVMPYMVRSAFADFPGKNGVPHVVELKMN